MKSIITRLEALERAQNARDEAIRIEKALRQPYAVYEPYNILRDEYDISYYPEGRFKKPVVLKGIAYNEVCKWMLSQDPNIYICIHMGSCSEWLFMFHQIGENAEKYTEEQRKNTLRRDFEQYPELKALFTSDEGMQLMSSLVRLPQNIYLKMETWQYIIQDSNK